MTEIMVELVKYDTEKTKKRKRSNLSVDQKTENAIIEKLEKIHKGDKIIAIHEVVWGEEIAKVIPSSIKEADGAILSGTVKFYDEEKGFGFIDPDSDLEDLFFHSTALAGEVLYEKDLVQFERSIGPKGPIAIRIKLIEKISSED